jgi:hypothetical protein
MTDGASVSSEAKVRRARKLYQGFLGFNMCLHLLIGLLCIFVPYWVSRTFDLPRPIPTGWVRGWGATLLLVTALYVPGLRDPAGHREPNYIGVGGRFWMGTIWLICGGGFLAFSIFDYMWAVILGFLYLRFVRTVKSHPGSSSA